MQFHLFLFSFFLTISAAWSYPNFIGYGYRSCLACHESSTGGGALTDYARGVYASEISMNPFSKWMTEEDLSGISNFLGSQELPYWVRVGFKYRSLELERNPGSSQSSKLYFNMQNDLNLNFFTNEAHTLGLINTLGYLTNPNAIAPNKTFSDNPRLFMKEYFIKYRYSKEWWINAGFMDKAFGIKTANHTAVNRAQIGLGTNDQSHALLAHWIKPDEDYFFQILLGNLHLSKADQKVGASVMYEAKWSKSHAYGIGLLTEKKETANSSQIELHNKMGFGEGNAMLMEIGYRSASSTSNNTTTDSQNFYLFSEGQLGLTKGLFILSGLETSKNTTNSSSLDLIRWNLGFLAFPMQRLELRFSGVNQKTYNAPEATQDEWSLQTQVHLSL